MQWFRTNTPISKGMAIASDQSQSKPQQWKYWVWSPHVWHLGDTLVGCGILRTCAASPPRTALLQQCTWPRSWADCSLGPLSGGISHLCFHEVSSVVPYSFTHHLTKDASRDFSPVTWCLDHQTFLRRSSGSIHCYITITCALFQNQQHVEDAEVYKQVYMNHVCLQWFHGLDS